MVEYFTYKTVKLHLIHSEYTDDICSARLYTLQTTGNVMALP